MKQMEKPHEPIGLRRLLVRFSNCLASRFIHDVTRINGAFGIFAGHLIVAEMAPDMIQQAVVMPLK
jgi:hypothetical protein